MARRIQFRRGSSLQHSVFVGAPGELTVDTDKNIVVVHDGITPGGFPANRIEDVQGNASFSGRLTITSGIPSTSMTTGALVVNGGAGILGRINSDSMLLTSTQNSSSTTTGALVVNGGIGVSGIITANQVRATNNIVSFFSSDLAFKENICTIPNALEKVLAIGGKIFNWTDDYINAQGGIDEYFLRKEDYGVIAQDVLKVFPLAVRKRPDDSLAVDYNKLSTLAFAAITELNQKIKDQQSEIERLKKRINDGLSG